MLLSIYSSEFKSVEVDVVPELVKQFTLVGWARTPQHLDLGPLGAPGRPLDHVAHELLGGHSALLRRQVVAVPLAGFIEVTFVLN